jgi:hypothetical protein
MKASTNSQKLSVKKSIVSNLNDSVINFYETIIVHTRR